MKTSPTRLEPDVVEAAKVAAPKMSRSTAQQVNHWARIGRELEMSLSMSHRGVSDVLAGVRRYDELDARSQALVRAGWGERMAEIRADLDLAAEFTATGRTWTEVDDDGNLVVRGES